MPIEDFFFGGHIFFAYFFRNGILMCSGHLRKALTGG